MAIGPFRRESAGTTLAHSEDSTAVGKLSQAKVSYNEGVKMVNVGMDLVAMYESRPHRTRRGTQGKRLRQERANERAK